MNIVLLGMGYNIIAMFIAIGMVVLLLFYLKAKQAQKQKKCEHEFEQYRICKKCLIKQKQE